MNRNRIFSLARILAMGAAFATIAIAPACKSPKEKAEGQVIYRMSQLRSDLERAPNLIDLTTEALTRATSGQNPNRAADFATLQTRLDELQASTKRLTNEVITAKGDSDRFFREWAREANRTSAGQRAEISEDMAARRANRDRALEYLRNADTAYASYVTQVEAVERALLTDMSENSIQAVSPMVSNAFTDGNKAKEFLYRVNEQVDAALASR